MSKYIDTEKLKSAIVKYAKLYTEEQDILNVINDILVHIDSLQQEQLSLPDDLDEAELKYVESLDNPPANQEEERTIYQTFKAGAEWMAGQGYTVDGIVICDKELTRGYKDIVMSIPNELKVDDKVTIQIRKL